MKKHIYGFTLIELLIVIGIIAVLAVVSIIGFNSFQKRACISNDIALLSQVNLLLEADEKNNGKKSCVNDVVNLLKENNIDIFNPVTKDYQYVYNIEKNKFVLVDEGLIEVYQTLSRFKEKNFLFISERSLIDNSDNLFSLYLKDDYQDDSNNLVVNKPISLDLGNYKGYKNINYCFENKNENDIYLYNNYLNSDLQFENCLIKHYGLAYSVNVLNSEYEENGLVCKEYLNNSDVLLNRAYMINLINNQSNIKENEAMVFNMNELNNCNHDNGYLIFIEDGYSYCLCWNCACILKEGSSYDDIDGHYLSKVIRRNVNGYHLGSTFIGECTIDKVLNFNRIEVNDYLYQDGYLCFNDDCLIIECHNNKFSNFNEYDNELVLDNYSNRYCEHEFEYVLNDNEYYKECSLCQLRINLDLNSLSNYWLDYRSSCFKSGEGSIDCPYLISNARELALLSYNVNSLNKDTDKYYELNNDIDLDGKLFSPIGTNLNHFKGHFNGNGYCIRNLNTSLNSLKIEADNEDYYLNENYSIFGYCEDVSISNLSLENIKIDNKDYFNNCGLLISKVIGSVYLDNISTDSNCLIKGLDYISGLIGSIDLKDNSEVVLNNIINKASVYSYNCNKSSNASGLIGYISGKNASNNCIYLNECHNEGSISSDGHSGALICLISKIKADPNDKYGASIVINKCSNKGDLYYSDVCYTNGFGAGLIVKIDKLYFNEDKRIKLIFNDCLFNNNDLSIDEAIAIFKTPNKASDEQNELGDIKINDRVYRLSYESSNCLISQNDISKYYIEG